MADREDSETVRRALRDQPVPEHRPGFWEELHARLADPFEVFASVPEPHRPARASRLVALAAALLVVAGAAGLVVAAREGGRRIDVSVEPGVSTTTERAGSTSSSSPTAERPAPDRAAAQRTALDWIDLLAAGDMEGAWRLLGPTAREGWGSYENFERARSGFAEGMGSWARANNRIAGASTLRRGDDDALHAVTITGVRHVEGSQEDGVLPLVVREAPLGTFLVEPFSPASAGISFSVPQPGQPRTLEPDTPVEFDVPAGGSLFVVVDRSGDPVSPARDGSGHVRYVPEAGWEPGRRAVTVVVLTDTGAVLSGAVVFDVAA